MKKKKIVLDILKYLVFFGIGIGLFFWIYRNQKFDTLWQDLSKFHYGWILASLAVAVVSHFLRAVRWRMLIQSIGYKPKLSNTFLSILVMYLANYGFPRLGEVTRCGILKKYDGVPFTSQLGTVFIERVVDFLFLLLILITVLFVDWDVLAAYVTNADPGNSSRYAFLSSSLFWALVLAILVAGAVLLIFRKRLMKTKLAQKIMGYAQKFLQGLKSVLQLKNPILFVLLTFGIYGCYFLMTWFVMIGFAPTHSLSPMAGLAVLALGSVGMVMPVQGGIGTYHGFVTYTLTLYGILESDALVLALVLHGSTTIFLILIGAMALGLLPVLNRKNRPGE